MDRIDIYEGFKDIYEVEDKASYLACGKPKADVAIVTRWDVSTGSVSRYEVWVHLGEEN